MKMVRNILIAAIFLLNYVLGYVESGTNTLTIARGTPTEITTHKFMVSIHIQRYRCGGCIISESLVITATHCVRNIDADLITVHVGSSYPEEGGLYKNVSEIFKHKNYIPATKRNDISLLLLRDRLTYDHCIGAINLPREGEMTFTTGTLIEALGFGETENGSYAQILQEGNLQILNNRVCEQVYDIRFVSQFCAYGLNGKLRKGDDGSPVLYRNKLIGIVSLIDDYHERGFNVLVRVPNYLVFIQRIMRRHT